MSKHQVMSRSSSRPEKTMHCRLNWKCFFATLPYESLSCHPVSHRFSLLCVPCHALPQLVIPSHCFLLGHSSHLHSQFHYSRFPSPQWSFPSLQNSYITSALSSINTSHYRYIFHTAPNAYFLIVSRQQDSYYDSIMNIP